ncbi:Solute carrier organic anion transporter family member 2B1 [Bagarius yarrelli]|uniref:Solute carrier organic anion transporter family member n=1 Tax=Bagarius yarrelli TaxID=175774 RepID=A0A556TXF3_BAGYA|nr:Solute carrier organic anion transporter family member 2B1 [Bagarius yarrelli]
MGLFHNIKFFVLCHGMLQLAQLLVSGYLKGSISTIERRYGLSSQKSGLLASFNEVGNTVLIVFVSFFGSRVHRPRCIGIGAILASMAAFLIALPHFFSDKYKYTDYVNSASTNHVSGLCQAEGNPQAASSNQTCTEVNSDANKAVFPILLLGQLLLGIGGVPIQPFGISYIDDYADKKNSPFYLAEIVLTKADPRWVGAWWLGFLLAGTLLFLTSLPYLFFPRSMITEETSAVMTEHEAEKLKEKQEAGADATRDLTLIQFLKKFPYIMLRTLRNPIYLLVVLAQVNLAAMVAGLATFMPKYIERQFAQTASVSNIMIGGLSIPSAMLGIIAGGMILRRFNLSVKASAILCCGAVLLAIIFAIPLLFLGCPTQKIARINYNNPERQEFTNVFFKSRDVTSYRVHVMYRDCSLACSCSDEAFNPVCGSDGVEFRSPCHAGCKEYENPLNYTDCACVAAEGSQAYALQGACRNSCSHLLVPFMVLSSLTCFLASLSHTPTFMMILRTVTPEDKSFALGIQFMLLRVLAFLPAPVLYGSAIDSTCILWGRKCNKNTSCHYYDMDHFRRRYLGLQTIFVFGGLVFFFLSFLVLRRAAKGAQLKEPEQMNSITTKEKQERERTENSNDRQQKTGVKT